MPGQEKPNGVIAEEPQVEERQSLRDIAEAAYDDITASEDEPSFEEPSVDRGGRQRDEYGRFVKADPGEAAAEEPPSPEAEHDPEADKPHPAPPQGEAAQAPSNWSAEDRASFEEQTEKGKAFLLRRHSEMESDYQKRVQATAVSNQFVQAVVPVFNDPDIAASLRQEGRSPIEAVYQWAGFHKRALSPDLPTRIELLFELADRMQIDPAAVFGLSATPAGLSKEDLANPAIKKFADTIGQTNSRIQALEAELQRRDQMGEAQLVATKRAEIDAFADRKNADGSLAHPLFDAYMPVIMEHFRTNPTWTIEQCYDAAIRPARDTFSAQARAEQERQQSLQRAQGAVRGNVRGMTAPVSKPAPTNGAKRSLRDILEESADEVGF
jgi:hypothetical protein